MAETSIISGRTTSELCASLPGLRRGLVAVAVASCVVNVLMLTAPLFMLQVYDRVLPSRSGSTLVGLAVFALAMFLFQGLFETIRGEMLLGIGRTFGNRLAPRVFDILAASRGPEGAQAMRDLDTIRAFVSGAGIAAFFDLPWMPIYIAVCFAFHPVLGWAVLGGALLLAGLTWLGDVLTRGPIREVAARVGVRQKVAESVSRNGLLIDALGMRGRMRRIWLERNDAYQDRHDATSGMSGRLAAATRMLRTVLQSGVLALGAWLVINEEASGGVMLAATILTIRALAPLEQVIAQWRGFVGSRQAWGRLAAALSEHPAQAVPTPLAAPRSELTATGVTVAAPGSGRPVLADVTFSLQAGSALGIIGPSGSGKSSLARALVGAWSPARGLVRLDGATFDQWPRDTIGACLGYMPQEAELFDGSVAENIARFSDPIDVEALQKAAVEAGLHDLVVRLPNGYDTPVGEGGALLSGGQRQRIALARALYGDPFLVVLDEPNANLDIAGEQALTRAIVNVRRRGGIVVVVAHRSSALAAVDRLMVLNAGRVQHFGARDQVLAQLGASPFPQPAAAAVAPAPERPRTRPARTPRAVSKRAVGGEGKAHA